MNNLKNCPFCGGEAEAEYMEWVKETKDGNDGTGWVKCLRCGARTDRDGLDEVMKAWNTRTQAADNLRLSNLVTQFDTAIRRIAEAAGMTEAFTGVDFDPECKPVVDRVKELKELADMYVGLL